jgi:hypothetical protein
MFVCWLDLLVGLEDGGSIFLQNAGKLLPHYTASHQRIGESFVSFVFYITVFSQLLSYILSTFGGTQ